jgi:hypothetical protein
MAASTGSARLVSEGMRRPATCAVSHGITPMCRSAAGSPDWAQARLAEFLEVLVYGELNELARHGDSGSLAAETGNQVFGTGSDASTSHTSANAAAAGFWRRSRSTAIRVTAASDCGYGEGRGNSRKTSWRSACPAVGSPSRARMSRWRIRSWATGGDR